jgi:hypothetical protein
MIYYHHTFSTATSSKVTCDTNDEFLNLENSLKSERINSPFYRFIEIGHGWRMMKIHEMVIRGEAIVMDNRELLTMAHILAIKA